MRPTGRCIAPNNNLFGLAILFLVAFLLVELVIRTYNLYQSIPPVDIPSHIAAGVALSTGAMWVLSLTILKRKRTAALTISLFIALIWEVLETMQELVIENPPYLVDVFFWDGVADVLFTLAGAMVGIMLLLLLKRFTHMLDGITV